MADLWREHALVLVAGRDEEGRESVEVLTSQGPCHLVDGFPAPLPAGRAGHAAAAVRNESLLVCGGLDAATGRLSRKCWSYSAKGGNEWKQVPGLRSAARYASAAALGGSVYVMGGTGAAGAKTAETQVFDSDTFTWSRGPPIPQPAWGQCAAVAAAGGGQEQLILTGGWGERAGRASLHHTFR